jgi:hypothetical protein
MQHPRKPEILDREPLSPTHRTEAVHMLARWHADAQGRADQPETLPLHPDDAYQVIAHPVRFELRITDNVRDRPTIQGVIFGSGHVVLCCFTGTGPDGVEVSSHHSFWEAVCSLDHLWITWLDEPPSWLRRQ